MLDKKRFVEATMWLRPFIRWATRFAMNSPPWLPAGVRNAPLRLSALILRRYHKAMR
jgi:hypothetical protein